MILLKIMLSLKKIDILIIIDDLDRFKQLNEDITTPNTYRTAGYPGHEYWQVEQIMI